MKDLKLAFPTGDDGKQKRTLEGNHTDYIYRGVMHEPEDKMDWLLKMAKMGVNPIITGGRNLGKTAASERMKQYLEEKSHMDFVNSVNKTKSDPYIKYIDPRDLDRVALEAFLGEDGDRSMDKDDVTNMVQRGMKFKVGDRVLDTSNEDEGYATVIGVKPGEVLLDYADLSGEAWRDAIFVDHVLPDNDYRFRDYEDWKLREIDKTVITATDSGYIDRIVSEDEINRQAIAERQKRYDETGVY